MSKNKIYIFITWAVHSIGGSELYTAGKANYLQNRGWKVYVFFNHPNEGKTLIPSLAQYIPTGSGMQFLYTPPYKMRMHDQEYCLNLMMQRLNLVPSKQYDIIIESHSFILAYWGELLAARIGARHFFVLLDEIPSSKDNWIRTATRSTLDFFYFKWKRNELIASDKALQKLFNGYKNVTAPLVKMPPTVREQAPIQDVAFPIEKIQRLDWHICHIGRAKKDYVPSVIEGVRELAERHPDKKINFIMVGNADPLMAQLEKTSHSRPNVFFTFLGDMFPIPRILFSKVDVVCAISQSARFAANEGILTIVGSANTPNRTPGVLGYDTEAQVYGAGTFSYVEALENVLVKKLYVGKKYSLQKLRPADEYYDNFRIIVKNASPAKEYYTERLSQERIRNWGAIFPFGAIARGARIILVGETEITSDYRRQITSQQNVSNEFGSEYVKVLSPRPYCQIVATVDEHPEEFDDEVVDMERLKLKDYDAIVICTYPPQAQAAFDKIQQIVPDMVNRIVYNFQMLSL